VIDSPLAFPATPGDIALYHGRLNTDQQVTAVIEFAGRLDVLRLQAALTLLVETVPLLSCALQIHANRFTWVQTPDYRPPLQVLHVAGDPQTEIARFATRFSDSSRQPPLELLLLQCANGDQLCIKMDHVQADGAGIRLILYLLAEAYTHARIEQPINPDRGYAQVLRRIPPLAYLDLARRQNYPSFKPARPQDRHPPQGTFIEHARLGPTELAAIATQAKRQGTTINNFLLAALYQVMFKRSPPAPGVSFSVMVPIDMRRYLPEQARPTVANLTSSIFPSLSYIENEPFPATLQRLTATMNRLKSHAPGLATFIGMALGSLFGGKIIQQTYQHMHRQGSEVINLTNIGVLDPARLAFADRPIQQIYGIGPLQFLPGLVILISTCQETLHIVVHSNHPRRIQPFMQSFIDEIISASQP
jgi:NRPS condensation-like uncharacterized protein